MNKTQRAGELKPTSWMLASTVLMISLAGCAGNERALGPDLAPSAIVGDETRGTQAQASGPAATLSPFATGKPAAPREIPASLPVAVVDGVDVPVPAIALGSPQTVRRIIQLGKTQSRVMEHLELLTKQIGPRLTASTNAERANQWTAELFRSWGFSADVVAWGQAATRFDRGPMSGKLLIKAGRRASAENAEAEWKAVRDFELTTLAWSRGTDGPVRGPVVRMPETEEEYAKVKDRLRGAWILIKPHPIGGRQGVRTAGQMAGERYTARKEARAKAAAGESTTGFVIEDRVIFDGVAGFIASSRDERVWTTSIPKWREQAIDQIIPDVEVVVRLSDYDAINSRLADGDEIQAEFDLKATLTPGPVTMYNTIAEMPGTERPGEVVILCAHLDSWNGPGSEGATDNGTGAATILEAARLLAAANAKPKRTIRFCLWTGEEQGLLGSRAYVKSLEEAGQLGTISAAFNEDGGTNYQGGLRPTKDMADLLAAATAPMNYQFFDSANDAPMVVDIKVQDSFPTFASSDHYAFVERGVPGFYFEEVGRADYGYGWHTQHDRFELAIPEYLMQSATNSAVVAYNIACAPELLPRIPDRPAAASTPSAPSGASSSR